MLVSAVFSPRYEAQTPTASMRKLPLVAHEVERRGWARLVEPEPVAPELLCRLHDPHYVRCFVEGTGPLASSQGWPWTPEIRDGVLAIQGGQLLGAELALREGLAANVAQGFHHAGFGRGCGFCTFNGLALVALSHPHLKVGVLDCDEHQGNGTAEFCDRLPNLFNATLFGTSFGAGESERSRNYRVAPRDFERYLEALAEAIDWLKSCGVDLVLFQAGMDPHENDPLGRLELTGAQLRERDRRVFRSLRHDWGIPCLFVLAGGYQEPIEDCLVPLHAMTFEEAFRANSADSETEVA